VISPQQIENPLENIMEVPMKKSLEGLEFVEIEPLTTTK
jgi:hypothetical protein